MDKKELDIKIADIAKSVLSYCTVRTANHFDAEDLAQNILIEIYKSADKIRNPDAFYAFLWAVAGNVYKQWCRSRANRSECELSETLHYETDVTDEQEFVYLLRRELSLLSEKKRKATILYYFENMSCSAISVHLGISESMVKYLLFKSRQILKEGMYMERVYGNLSFSPKELSVLYWGNGKKTYNDLYKNKISQNILFACYNDKLTAAEISLELGVALPYLEDIIKQLADCDALRIDGKRYYTNMVIFIADCAMEVANRTREYRKTITDTLAEIVVNGALGNCEAWLTVSCILYKAIFENLQGRVDIDIPENKFGENCMVWAVEKSIDSMRNSGFAFGVSNTESKDGDRVQFFDFPVNGDMVHHSFYSTQCLTDVFVAIAKDTHCFENEIEKAVVAELIKKGYVLQENGKLTVNAPVFTQQSFAQFMEQYHSSVEKVEENAEKIMDEAAKIIRNHIPVHLKKQSEMMAYFRIFEEAISVPICTLVQNKILFPYNGDGLLPTTYIILK